MSNYPPQLQHGHAVQPTDSNPLGVVGFVFSIVGVCTCGILSPLGLLVSGVGLFKAPRGFAVAGTITGLIGSIWLVTMGFAIVWGFLFVKESAEMAIDAVTTVAAFERGSDEIESYRQKNNTLPDAILGNELVDEIEDGWEQSILYAVEDQEAYTFRSAGPDGEFHTEDDITWNSQDAKRRRSSSDDGIDLRADEIDLGIGGMTIRDGDRSVEISTGGIKSNPEDGSVTIGGGRLQVKDKDRQVDIELPSIRGPQE